MNRGDIWLVDLGGHSGIRPVLILTRQGVIRFLNKVTVAEITTQGKGYPTEVAIGTKGNLPQESFIQLDNLQTVSKDKFIKFIGALDSVTMSIVSQKIIFALHLEDGI